MASTIVDYSTPDIPESSAVLKVGAVTRINAPASLVFRMLRNTETWKDWNRWVPHVTVTYQPDEEDLATSAEIAELVRNTSIAVSIDSDLTEALAEPARRRSTASGAGSRPTSPGGSVLSPGPVTRQRLASNASKASEASRNLSPPGKAANGETPAPVGHNILLESPSRPSYLMPAPPNTNATATALSHSTKRNSMSVAAKKQMHINALYGEPSVRIQLGTKMTFHVRMKLPATESRQLSVVVTELSRPNDPQDEPDPLERTPTHTISRSGVYRIVWSVGTNFAPPKSFPKWLLQGQRVHEIRPIVRGDGKEECEYVGWECQRGVLAKTVKSRYGKYIEERFREWGEGLRDFCESMGGAVERRDFSVN